MKPIIRIVTISSLIGGASFVTCMIPDILRERRAEKNITPWRTAWQAGDYEKALLLYMKIENRYAG